MKEYFGKKIFGGIAIGKISFYSKNQNVVVRKKTEDSEGEMARYEACLLYTSMLYKL